MPRTATPNVTFVDTVNGREHQLGPIRLSVAETARLARLPPTGQQGS